MLDLPKVEKGVRRALSKLEKVKNVVSGVALALGVVMVGVPSSDAQASTAESVQKVAPVVSSAMLLTPAAQQGVLVAYHHSHSSHASHASHYSHYSSRG